MAALLGLAAALALLAGLLRIPLDVHFSAAVGEKPDLRMRIEWLFGRVGFDVGGRERARPKTERARWRPGLRQLSPLADEGFQAAVARLLRRWRSALSAHALVGRGRLGLSDPAETGIAMGIVQPLLTLLDVFPGVDVRVAPEFTEPVLEGRVAGGLRLIPLGVIAPALAFAVSPIVWKTFRAARSKRR